MYHRTSAQRPDSTDAQQKPEASIKPSLRHIGQIFCYPRLKVLLSEACAASGTLQFLQGQARPKEAPIQPPGWKPVPSWCASDVVQCVFGAQPRYGTDIMIPFYFFSRFFWKKFLACCVF